MNFEERKIIVDQVIERLCNLKTGEDYLKALNKLNEKFKPREQSKSPYASKTKPRPIPFRVF